MVVLEKIKEVVVIWWSFWSLWCSKDGGGDAGVVVVVVAEMIAGMVTGIITGDVAVEEELGP